MTYPEDYIGKVICGDVLSVLKTMPDESVDTKGRFKKGYTWRKPKPYWNKDWLYNQYVVLNRSSLDIAKEFGCYDTNIHYFLKKFKIKTRTTSEIRKNKYWGASGVDNPMWNKKGELNPNWKGGITPERQLFYTSQEWKNVCQIVWKRDKATCQRCGVKRDKTDIPFHIHHIKTFADKELRADEKNLILLCEVCHYFVHSKKNKLSILLFKEVMINAPARDD